MTIQLPEHLERYVHDQVLAGRFRTEDDVILDETRPGDQINWDSERVPVELTIELPFWLL